MRIQSIGLLAILCLLPAAATAELRVAVTTPDLASLVEEIGGDEVEVTTFVKGPQDPHFIEPRPSFIRELSRADLFVQIGLGLEDGWAPVLLRSARNADVLPGRRGYLDASTAIDPLQRNVGTIDRSMGDVHPYGNPHYLLDPLNGLAVAAAIRDRLAELDPERAEAFRRRYEAFEQRLEERVRGWQAELAPYEGTLLVVDHELWPYFTRRFQLEVVAALEPVPGIAPTTRHLGEVIETVRARDVPAILSVPYFDTRHARAVAEKTDAEIVPMAHQAGGREGTDGYLAMVGYNVERLARALGDAGSGAAPAAETP